jgi:hypothetical protein
MARENQGLQIALIIFVMLTIILGVTTFLFFRSYDDADTRARQAQKDADAAKTAAAAKASENNQLKTQIIGFKDTDEMSAVTEEFNKDMKAYAGAFPETTHVYRQVVAQLAKALQDKSSALVAMQGELDKFKADYKVREASKDPQIKDFENAATKAGQDLAGERAKFKADYDRITAAEAAMKGDLDKARKDAAAQMAENAAKIQDLEKRLANLGERYKQRNREYEGITKETYEVAAGEVEWVNQRAATAWINLGRADALGRMISFAVFDRDATDLSKAGKKASIEVTEVLGDHLALARVVDDNPSNPIMPGDKIYTPVWVPGEKRHFGLTGFVDLNGDGKSDMNLLRDIIAASGGVVDAWTDDKGENHGQMTMRTRYLVMGEEPTGQMQGVLQSGQNQMIDKAKELGIERLPLDQLLTRMGWKNQTPVVHYGPGSNVNDFRAKAPEGVPRVSTGKVSDLYNKPRTPPKPGANGAF